MKKFLISFILLVFIYGCGSKSQEKAEMNGAEPTQTLADGQKVYQTYCMVCHQKDGNGVAGLYPPLSATEWVTGDKDRLISILLYGLKEPIIVKGEEYENMMPPHHFLSDENIAAVLTYIRSNFGNNASAITPAEVSALRN